MRTPNTKCIVCNKPLYRRPSELKMVVFVCCKDCRGSAYKKRPNINSLNNLNLGRKKGDNGLKGIPKSKESKKKRSDSMKLWCRNNPAKSKERAIVHKGENHHLWNGGSSEFNKKIRLLNENRIWMDSTKERDNYKCVKCQSVDNLESHHKIELSELLYQNNIKSTDEARLCKKLWDIENGITLCRKCHYDLHGRSQNAN